MHKVQRAPSGVGAISPFPRRHRLPSRVLEDTKNSMQRKESEVILEVTDHGNAWRKKASRNRIWPKKTKNPYIINLRQRLLLLLSSHEIVISEVPDYSKFLHRSPGLGHHIQSLKPAATYLMDSRL